MPREPAREKKRSRSGELLPPLLATCVAKREGERRMVSSLRSPRDKSNFRREETRGGREGGGGRTFLLLPLTRARARALGGEE